MKKMVISLSLVVAALLIIFSSCKKESSKIALTNAAAKTWFDTRCASCHSSGKSNAADWLYDASDYDGSIKGHIAQIKTEVTIDKSMPDNSWLVSDSTTFATWYSAGYPAN